MFVNDKENIDVKHKYKKQRQYKSIISKEKKYIHLYVLT